MTLRPYQLAMLDDLRAAWRRAARACVMVAPTGAGKTHLLAHIASSCHAKGWRVAIVAHRREILEQDGRSLSSYGTDPAAPGVTLTTIQAAVRHEIGSQDLIILDEAHLAMARTWRDLMAAQQTAKVIGFTATPYRTDGQGLGAIFGAMIRGPQVAELVQAGYLVPARTFAPDIPDLSGVSTKAGDWAPEGLSLVMRRPQIVGNMVEHYQKLAAGRQALIFAVDIEHSRQIEDAFGPECEHLDGKTPTAKRDEIVQAFRAGQIKMLTSCNILSEGLDVPGASCVILARPTQSEVLYRQQIGRGSRACDSKTDFIILDHAGNAIRHGLFAQHKSHSLTSEKRSRRERQDGDGAVRQCLNCYAVFESAEVSCPTCGWSPPVKQRRRVEIAGELVELTDDGKLEPGRFRWIMRSIWQSPREQWRLKLMEMAESMGYRRGWVNHQLDLRSRHA